MLVHFANYIKHFFTQVSNTFKYFELKRIIISETSHIIVFQEYVKTDPSGRDPEKVQMVVIKQGYEPPQFTGHFQAWNDDVFAVSCFFTRIRERNKERCIPAHIAIIARVVSETYHLIFY